MDIFPCFSNRDSSHSKEHSQIVYLEGGPHEAEVQVEAAEKTEKISPHEAEVQALARDPDAYFRKQGDKMKKTIYRLADGKNAQEHIVFVDERISDLKAQYEAALKAVRSAEELSQDIHEAAQQLMTKVQLRIDVSKRIKKSPALEKIYEQVKDNFYGLSQERVMISIDKIFQQEKDPDKALQRVHGEMLKENALGFASEKPAKPDELISFGSRFGREQMLQIYEHMGINFDSLTFSADQIAKVNSISQIYHRFEGLTYAEMGILDARGNVTKEGLDKLLNYEQHENHADEIRENMTNRVEGMRSYLSSRASMFRSIQASAKEHYGREGKLPTLNFEGHSFDLNQIAQEHEQAFQKFSNLYEDTTPIEQLDEVDKMAELPKSLEGLLNYRFDEANGMRQRVYRELPSAVKSRLESLGLKEVEVRDINRGRIRTLEFKYKGEKIRLSMGKNSWGDDYQPHLHIYNGNQKLQSRPIDLANITRELDSIHQYKVDNQENIDAINQKFFSDEKPDKLDYYGSFFSQMTLLDAKEDYLGSLKSPPANDLRPIEQERLQKIEQVLPMILANADALGIHEDMNLLQALVKIYASPNRDELLGRDYSSTLNGLKNPNSSHYRGVEPRYGIAVYEDKDLVEKARKDESPEYKARKEQLAAMKPGDKLEIEFEGEKYNFKLVDSFADYEYRFELEGFEDQPDFKLNNLDLLEKSPEEQLQYLMGSDFRRTTIDSAKLLNGQLEAGEAPKKLSVKHSFEKGTLTSHPYFKNLPLNNQQRELLEDLNNEEKTRISLSTDRYGNITDLQVQWEAEENQTRYTLKTESGNYWRMISLADKSGRTRYPFYDVETQYVEPRMKRLTEGV